MTGGALLGKFFLKGGHYYVGGHYSAARSSGFNVRVADLLRKVILS